MKKLIFAIVMMLAMALVSYGKPANKNTELLKGLTSAVKNVQTSSIVASGAYKKLSFNFTGKSVSAFYDAESEELIGFSIPLTIDDLPAGTVESIKSKYSGYTIKESIMFIYKSGYFGFYISLSRPEKPTIVIDVNTKGKARYFTKM